MHVSNMLSENPSSIADVDFFANIGRNGGALYVNQSMHLSLTDCRFSSNLADMGGGGMAAAFQNIALRLTDCSFTGNDAGYYGGGLSAME